MNWRSNLGNVRERVEGFVPHAVALGDQQAQLSRMAAALAYRTLFGMIPVIVVGVAMLGAFTSQKEMEGLVRDLIRFTGLSDITLAQPAEGTEQVSVPLPLGGGAVPVQVPVPGPGTDPTEVEAVAEVRAEQTQRLEVWIAELVSRVQDIPFGAIGVFGLMALIYAALSMMVEVEQAFNQIYRAPTGRSWTRRITQYWTLLTLGTLLLVASFYVSERVRNIAAEITGARLVAPEEASRVGAGTAVALSRQDDHSDAPADALFATPGADAGAAAPSADAESPKADARGDSALIQPAAGFDWRSALVRGVGFLATVVISTGLLLILYTTIPNTRVTFAPALLGAAIGAILWETGKWGFTLYLRYSASYAQLYGSIALIPLSMLWVYVTWMIVLLGLQIAHAAQTLRAQGRAGLTALFGRPDEGAGRPLVVDPGASLGVMAAMAANFRAGKSADVCEVAKVTGLDERVTEVLLDRLSTEGLLHKVQRGKETAFALARPPEAIDAKETLRVGHALAAGAPASADATSGMPGPYAMLMGLLENTRLALADGKSLADFLLNLPEGSASGAGAGGTGSGGTGSGGTGSGGTGLQTVQPEGRAELVPGPVGPSLGAMVAPGHESAAAPALVSAQGLPRGPENGRAAGGLVASAGAPEPAAPTPTIAANTAQGASPPGGVRTPERPRAGV